MVRAALSFALTFLLVLAERSEAQDSSSQAVKAWPAEAVLKEGGSLKIQVQTPAGDGARGVTVVCIDRSTNAVLRGISIQGGGQRLETDAQGYFALPLNSTNLGLAIANEKSFCLAQPRDLAKHPVMVLQPWARIEGIRKDHGRPLGHHRVALELITRGVDLSLLNYFAFDDEAETDSEGHFVFERVPPVEVFLVDLQPWEGTKRAFKTTPARLQEIDPTPGETRRVEAATQGRTIIGRIDTGAKLAGVIQLETLDESLLRNLAAAGFDPGKREWVPAECDTPEKRVKWYLDYFKNSETGRQRKEALSRFRAVMIRGNGSFISRMVEPGSYVLRGHVFQNGRDVALLGPVDVLVPPARDGKGDEPVDIGTITLEPTVNLNPGDLAPNFTTASIDGSQINLSDFRGKYVLVDFWTVWCRPCVAETPYLKATYEAFLGDSHFCTCRYQQM